MASMMTLITAVIAIGSLYSIIGSAAPAALSNPSFLAIMKELEEFVPRERRDVREIPTPEVDKNNSASYDTSLRLRGLRVTSSIAARFAKTLVTCHVVNPASRGQEVNFYIELPKEAFISGFLIETEGKVYRSRVDEKEKAKAAYEQAKQQGQTTGHVSQTSEKKNDFTVSINVAAEGALSFNMTYEELLKRHNGYFRNAISISPRQLVKHLIVNVHIDEPQGIDESKMDFFLERPTSTDYNREVVRPHWAEMKRLQRDRVHVQFHPNTEEQELFSPDGNLGKFVVRYDVIHEENAGKIEIVNGYFVHHFSPAGLRPVSKNVVFVLDTSGSMSGTKIRQTKEAMERVLSQLREQDHFGLITFASHTSVWGDAMMAANKDNIEPAKAKIRKLVADGGTDLHGGIVAGIDMLEDFKRNELGSDGAFSLIVMLTDGQPTSGAITNTNAIVADIKERMEGRFSLFCLGFGDNVDYSFLEKLSLQNRGLARKIYEDADAGLQLVGFFDEVATPLLTNIEIKYENNAIETNSVSQTEFPAYFDGTELVVAGRLASNGTSMPTKVICTVLATGWMNKIRLVTETKVKNESESMLSPRSVDDFAQRLWAFLTIKELLRKRAAADGDTEKANLTARALELSLKYHFVTPLTSLVVVKPDEKPVVDGGKERPVHIMSDGGRGRGLSVGSSVMAQNPPRRFQYPNRRKKYRSGGGRIRATSFPVNLYRPPIPNARMAPTYAHPPYSVTSVESTAHTTTAPATTTVSRTAVRPHTKVNYVNPSFLIHDKRSNVTMCFDVNAAPGDHLVLLDDPVNELVVEAQVASALNHPSGNGPIPLIIDRLLVTLGRQKIVVSTEQISSEDGTFSLTYWSTNRSIQLDGGLNISVSGGTHLALQPMAGISLVVTRNAGRHQEDKADYLGFNIESGKGFSDSVAGWIGSFVGKDIRLEADSVTKDEGQGVRGYIRVGGQQRVEVTRSVRQDIREDETKQCWYSGGKSA